MRSVAPILIIGLMPVVAFSQLYLISGTPNDGTRFGAFPMNLLQVTPERSAKLIKELVSTSDMVDWLTISYESRKALIWPAGIPPYNENHGPDAPLIVLDLDKAGVVKRCQMRANEKGIVTHWLAEVPGKGMVLEWFGFLDDPTRGYTHGMLMDPSVPCEQSFTLVPPDDITHFVAHGNPGVANMNVRDGISGAVDKDGRIWSGGMATSTFTFPYRAPPELRPGSDYRSIGLMINNSQVMVVTYGDAANPNSPFFVLRKRDNTWHSLAVQSDYYARLRAFDNFIAVVEGRIKKTMARQRGRGMIQMGLKDEPGDKSAGRKDWKGETAYGPDQESRFLDAAEVYPGRLHLYDVETERLFTITTHQADSEILLVENKTAYYRISDRLYSAPVTEKGIGAAVLLATSDLVRYAHWAFIKH